MKRILCMLLLSALSFCAQAADKPNVIIFLVDDMGVMDTSVPFLTDEAGQPKVYPLNEFYRTPNMGRLAERGIRFNDFCAQSVCSPTRASIVTGQNSPRHGTTTWIRPDSNNGGKNGAQGWNWEGLTKEDVTLPRVLQADGYRTIHVGKAHFGAVDTEGADPLNLGFDVNVGGTAWGHQGHYYGQKSYGKGTNRAVPHLEAYHGTDTFLTDALTLEANKEIAKSVAAGQPFFLHMSHYAVHAPFIADPRFIQNYANFDKPKKAKEFATLIEGMDKSLGDIMDHVEALGVAEETLIIFLGDNGSAAPLGGASDIACSAPLRGKKGSCYEGGTRVPFIAAWAKPNPQNQWQKKLPIVQGVIQSQMGTVMDLYPTILELSGVANPEGHVVDGSSLKTLFTGQEDPSRDEIFLMHFPHPHSSKFFTSYRQDGWKLIYHYNPVTSGEPTYELFHLKADPFENHNLADSNPERLASMMQSMIAQLEEEGALYPVDQQKKPLKPRLN